MKVSNVQQGQVQKNSHYSLDYCCLVPDTATDCLSRMDLPPDVAAYFVHCYFRLYLMFVSWGSSWLGICLIYHLKRISSFNRHETWVKSKILTIISWIGRLNIPRRTWWYWKVWLSGSILIICSSRRIAAAAWCGGITRSRCARIFLVSTNNSKKGWNNKFKLNQKIEKKIRKLIWSTLVGNGNGTRSLMVYLDGLSLTPVFGCFCIVSSCPSNVFKYCICCGDGTGIRFGSLPRVGKGFF